MALSIGDIIQFDLKGNFNNLVETHNVFHYEVASDVGARGTFNWLSDAGLTFANYVLDNILGATATAMWYESIKAQVVFGADAGIQNTALLGAAGYTGDVAFESLPPHVVWTFRKQGAGGTQRNGYQHYSGVSEANQIDGFASSNITAQLASIATELGLQKSVFEAGDDGNTQYGAMKPVIVKRVANGENPDDIDIIAKWYPVGVAYAKIGSVNSRKFGVGV